MTVINSSKYRKYLIGAALIAVLVFLCAPFLPRTERQRIQSKVQVEFRYCYALNVNGKDVLYMNDLASDWSSTIFSSIGDSLVCNTDTLNGCWTDRWLYIPSCQGRIRVPDMTRWQDSIVHATNGHIKEIVKKQEAAFAERLRQLTRATMGLDYYLDVHNVTDEGYNSVASYASEAIKRKSATARALAVLQQVTPSDSVNIQLVQHYAAITQAEKLPCTLIPDKRRGNDILIQTINRQKPKEAYASYLNKTDSTAPLLHTKHKEYDGEYVDGKREGHGILSLSDGTYYNGMWQGGSRNGFGLGIDSIGNVSIGEWKDDKFMGERLVYTNDRIYGIDISRYQHDIGKKRYRIDWQKLRISNLGTKSNKRISGTVDYPVSFCYIKSTEGTSIRNRYFASDYTSAKKRGIRTGAYHFFSTKSSGTAQASYFLKHTYLRHGDLPPVLDVEPSASQIRAMGGTTALFNHIRAWMRAVERKTGTKPILYVGQTFVNKYLVEAPDIKRDYQIWIARYGEYKPDVQLVIWQLCQDGRVSGIRGAVDINVFNGYRDQFEDFLEQSCIR